MYGDGFSFIPSKRFIRFPGRKRFAGKWHDAEWVPVGILARGRDNPVFHLSEAAVSPR